MRLGLLCGVLLVARAAPAQSPEAAREAVLGRELAAEVERQHALLGDRGADAFVARLAAPLAVAAGLPYRLTVKVLATDEPFATTLPGGYLYLSAGVIARAESEEDLARALAHQVAHLALPRVRVGASGTVPLIFLGGTGGLCSRFANAGAVPAAYRQIEPEADRLAGEYLRATGLDHTEAGAGAEFSRIRERLAKPPAPRRAPSLRNPRRP